MRQGFLGLPGAQVSPGQHLAHRQVVRKCERRSFQNFHGALIVVVVDGRARAAYAPVGPDGLHRLALGRGQVLAASQAHQRRIERAIVLGVVEQPRVLDLDIRGRRLLELCVVGLHAVHVLDGVGRVACRWHRGWLRLPQIRDQLRVACAPPAESARSPAAPHWCDWSPGEWRSDPSTRQRDRDGR